MACPVRRFQSTGRPREFNGHGIAVHPVHAGTHNIAEGVAVVLLRGNAAGAGAGDTDSDAACGREQEVAGAAGGIDDGDAEETLYLVVGFRLDAIEYGIEGTIEQGLYQAVGRVVAARSLALVALGFVALGKGVSTAVIGEDGREFKEAFVDRAEFFGLHVSPVDGDEAGVVLEPGQAVYRLHEGPVRKAGAFEFGDDRVFEQSAEGGKG